MQNPEGSERGGDCRYIRLPPGQFDAAQTIAFQTCYFWDVRRSPIESISAWPLAVAVVTLVLLTNLASASEYCTKEQYERDHALIADAFSKGTLVKGPKGLRDSILVKEDEWFKMNYLQQISFMQSFECSEAGLSGKQLLYMDVRSLATGRLLATWTLGQLKPAEGPGYLPNSGRPEVDGPDVDEDENRIGLTGRARAALINSTIDACRSKSGSQTFCSCYANAFADSVSIQELKEMSAIGNQEAEVTALRPKIEAATRRCSAN